MSTPHDFGLFRVIRSAVEHQSWFEGLNGIHTSLPPSVSPPCILVGIEGLRWRPNQFTPRARVECHLRVLGAPHDRERMWRVMKGITATLDGRCFDLDDEDTTGPDAPFVLFRETETVWVPGLWNGQWSHVLMTFVCHVRTAEGFL